jgi:hypothetical protein
MKLKELLEDLVWEDTYISLRNKYSEYSKLGVIKVGDIPLKVLSKGYEVLNIMPTNKNIDGMSKSVLTLMLDYDRSLDEEIYLES